jgi:hypothetical protein
METGMAIKVNYWTSTDHPADFYNKISGMTKFKNDLAENYLSVVKGRPAGAGGGTSFIIEIISTFSLSHLVMLLLEGVTYDLIKQGTNAFVLRPFIAAYKILCNKNKNHLILSELCIEFQDISIIFHDEQGIGIVDHIGEILVKLAEQYDHLSTDSGMKPDRIHIPVVENPDKDSPYKFRILGNIDETIHAKGPEDFFGFWGLEYDIEHAMRIYDVQKKLLIGGDFCTLEQYYRDYDRRRKKLE